MTPAQLASVKAYILSVPALAAQPMTSDGAFEIARQLNLPASPDFIVWKTAIQTGEIGKTISYVAYAAMTASNQTQLNGFITLNPQSFPPTNASIRSFFANTFSGALGGDGQTTRDALEALWRRTATLCEKVFSTGTGTTLSPATLGYEGLISYQDVQAARAS